MNSSVTHFATIRAHSASLVFVGVLFIFPARSQGQATDKPKDVAPTASAASASPTGPVPSAPAPKQARALILPGMLMADESVDLYAKASGFVAKVNVDIGARVKKGDILAELDIPEMTDELHHGEATLAARRARVDALKAKATQAELAIEAARAEFQRASAERELSRITFQRKVDLHKEKAIPDQDLDEAKNRLAIADAQVLIAQAKVAGAEGDLRAVQADGLAAEAEAKVAEADFARLKTLMSYTSIIAPFDGVVTARNIDRGAFVRSAALGAGMSLFTVKKTDRLRLVIDIPEAEAALVRVGMPLEVQLQSVPAPLPDVTISRIADSVRADTRTMRAEADIDNADGRLMPGVYAKVTIHLPTPTATSSGGA